MKTEKMMMLVVSGLVAAADGGIPYLQLRLRPQDTATDAQWEKTFALISSNTGCCDEVWFSTGTGVARLEEHRQVAARLVRGAEQLRKIGVVPSLQFQATIGHGDQYGTDECCAAKTWGGWTGSTGVTDRYCNCPRQLAFLDYLRAVAAAYAAFKPGSVWIDDDLRLDNHKPATDGSLPGCWCETCLAAFNRETGGAWMRERLAAAMADDAVLKDRWLAFSDAALSGVARAIAEAFHEHSPTTLLALQHGTIWKGTNLAVLEALHDVTGAPVGLRIGGGAWHEFDPNKQVVKSLASARFRKELGDLPWVRIWTSEVESCPRLYGCRSAQSSIVEAFSGLMFGLNAASFFITATVLEPEDLISRSVMRPLADAAPVLRGYAKATENACPAGFAVPTTVKDPYYLASAGLPILFGVGHTWGELTEKEGRLDRCWESSAVVQETRDAVDRRFGGVPVTVASPFVGLVAPHVDAAGRLRTVALLNVRIDEQGPILLRLRGLDTSVSHVVWRELRRRPVVLPVQSSAACRLVEIPSVGAWNGGYLDLVHSDALP